MDKQTLKGFGLSSNLVSDGSITATGTLQTWELRLAGDPKITAFRIKMVCVDTQTMFHEQPVDYTYQAWVVEPGSLVKNCCVQVVDHTNFAFKYHPGTIQQAMIPFESELRVESVDIEGSRVLTLSILAPPET